MKKIISWLLLATVGFALIFVLLYMIFIGIKKRQKLVDRKERE